MFQCRFSDVRASYLFRNYLGWFNAVTLARCHRFSIGSPERIGLRPFDNA
jgi:hypothetical protein